MEKNQKGFTIIELLVAMAILGLLIGIMIPGIAVVRRGARNTARKTGCQTIQGKIEEYYGTFRIYPPVLVDGEDKSDTAQLYVSSEDVDVQFDGKFVLSDPGDTDMAQNDFYVLYDETDTGYTLTCYLEPNNEPYIITVK